MDRGQPIAQLDMAGLEDCPDFDSEFPPARIALVEANPIAFALQSAGAINDAAMQTIAAVRPNTRLDIGVGGGFIVEVRGRENGFSHGRNSLCRNHISCGRSRQV